MIVTGMGCKSGSIQWLSKSCLGHPWPHPICQPPSPVPADRGEFQFFAVEREGRKWHWNDSEMLWVAEMTDDTKRQLH